MYNEFAFSWKDIDEDFVCPIKIEKYLIPKSDDSTCIIYHYGQLQIQWSLLMKTKMVLKDRSSIMEIIIWNISE